jgi:hypothetical protein
VSPVNEATNLKLYVPILALLVVLVIIYIGDEEKVNTVVSIAAPAEVVKA